MDYHYLTTIIVNLNIILFITCAFLLWRVICQEKWINEHKTYLKFISIWVKNHENNIKKIEEILKEGEDNDSD